MAAARWESHRPHTVDTRVSPLAKPQSQSRKDNTRQQKSKEAEGIYPQITQMAADVQKEINENTQFLFLLSTAICAHLRINLLLP